MNNMKQLLLAMGIIMASGAVVARDSESDHNDREEHCDRTAGNYTNKTHFSDSIGCFQSGAYLNTALFREHMASRCDECAWGSAFQIVPFGGKTTHRGSKKLGQWFGLNHKHELTVSETYDTTTGLLEAGADLDARHFNIVTPTGSAPFKSKISFRPQQTFFGVGLDWKQALIFNDDNSVRWWAEISAPVMRVKNTMDLEEEIIPTVAPALVRGGLLRTRMPDAITSSTGLDGAPHVASMVKAFDQDNWKYGKIAAKSHDENGNEKNDHHEHRKHHGKWGVADLEIKFGYNGMLTDCAALSSYVGVVVPTGTKEKAHYVFEPLVGSKHWGVEAGSQFSFGLFNWCESKIELDWDFNARYMFGHKAWRSFDLIGKPWSRYMEMYASFADAVSAQTAQDAFAGTSGINLMTRDVHVTPRLQINNNIALLYRGCSFTAEAGWTFYARQNEKICPNWEAGPVLKSRRGMGYLTKARTIRDPLGFEATTFGPGSAPVITAHAAGGATTEYAGWTDINGVVQFTSGQTGPLAGTPGDVTITPKNTGGTTLSYGAWTGNSAGALVFNQAGNTQTAGFDGTTSVAIILPRLLGGWTDGVAFDMLFPNNLGPNFDVTDDYAQSLDPQKNLQDGDRATRTITFTNTPVAGDYLEKTAESSVGMPVNGDYLTITGGGSGTPTVIILGDLVPTQANYNLAKITENDIDWSSGAHEAVLANTIYGTIGYEWDNESWPMVFALGGAYDFACGNAAMTRWTVFGKAGVSF